MRPALNILIVADLPRLRATIRNVAQRMGLATVECSDGTAAREKLATLVPDLVLLDLVLPESSGFELCEFIRESPRHAQVPVIVMSDRRFPEDRAHAFEVGADAFLSRPFSDAELQAAIDAQLSAAARPAPKAALP